MNMDEICAICRQPRGAHSAGSMHCPPRSTTFTPCKHPNRLGSGAMSSDGTGWSDSTCMVCGDRQVIGTPPYSTNTSGAVT